MKNFLLSAALVFAAAGTSLAQANLQQSYNFFDFGYERTSFKGDARDLLDSGDGLAVDFMASPNKNFLLASEYHYSRPSVGGDKISTHDWKIGAGGYFPLGRTVSFYTHLGGRYLRANTNLPDFNPSDWGFYIEPGVRFRPTESFEVYGALEYTRISDTNQFAGKAGGVYFFSETFGIEIFGRFGDDWANSYGAGVRIGW